jgi:predicted MFS family arabinose efflux permease
MDRYGAKVLLEVSFLASTVTYFLSATANSILMLYASRVPAVLQHAVLAARVLVSLATPEGSRAIMLGYVGMAYDVGAVFGPALGGRVSGWAGPKAASWLAAVASALTLVWTLCWLLGASKSTPRLTVALLNIEPFASELCGRNTLTSQSNLFPKRIGLSGSIFFKAAVLYPLNVHP